MKRKLLFLLGEICGTRLERGNPYRKIRQNPQKSAEVIVAMKSPKGDRAKDRTNISPNNGERSVNIMKAEYLGNENCPQRDSTECEEYVGVLSTDSRETEDADGALLLEEILSRDNLNRAYKRVKANKGAPGVDGMTVEEALPWLKENRDELIERIKSEKYKPQPVRRVEIPKPDGGKRLLGVPTVIDRIIQQAIAQKLMPIYEPLFADGSYGFRPNRDAHKAIRKVV